MGFSIEIEELQQKGVLIALFGEVDLYSAPELKKELFGAISDGAKEVIVDFSKATFIDSTTLGVLVAGVKRIRAKDGRLSLICSNRHITSVFDITGLNRSFPMYPTKAEAIAALGSSPLAAL